MDEVHVTKAKEFVKNNIKNEFSLCDIASYAGYSAFHFAREFKISTGFTIMEYTRRKRIEAAAKELGGERSICDIALDYCFETHSGFTKAFAAVMGCPPARYQEHIRSMNAEKKGVTLMEDSKIVIRHICMDDVDDLWENVYSAMTPRQIKEIKIIPSMEAYQRREGLQLVACVDGKVVMALPMTKKDWLPIGFLWDNNFTLTGGDGDKIFGKMLDEMKRQARALDINTLISPQHKDSESSKAMQSFGFKVAFESDGWQYLMMAV